jgi:hypothetical protein
MAIESWLVSRRLTELAGQWNEKLLRANDGEYVNRLMSLCKFVRFVPEARCCCRRLNAGISSNLTLNHRKLESLAYVTRSSVLTLLAIENSERTRQACIKHLRRWSIYFYPERPDLLEQMEMLGKECGGELGKPKLRTKYGWLRWLVGFRAAKKIQFWLPSLWAITKAKAGREGLR